MKNSLFSLTGWENLFFVFSFISFTFVADSILIILLGVWGDNFVWHVMGSSKLLYKAESRSTQGESNSYGIERIMNMGWSQLASYWIKDHLWMSDSYANWLNWFVEFFNWLILSFIFNNFFLSLFTQTLISLWKGGQSNLKRTLLGLPLSYHMSKPITIFWQKWCLD